MTKELIERIRNICGGCPDCKITVNEAADAIEALQARADNLKQQAKNWAHEARAANSTIEEIYQLCTGATGEPGNWHGAEPVRKLVAEINKLECDYADQVLRAMSAEAERDALAAELAAARAQEPVAYMSSRTGATVTKAQRQRMQNNGEYNKPLVFAAATPPVREPLTDATKASCALGYEECSHRCGTPHVCCDHYVEPEPIATPIPPVLEPDDSDLLAALMHIRAGLVDAKNTNIVDYIDAVICTAQQSTPPVQETLSEQQVDYEKAADWLAGHAQGLTDGKALSTCKKCKEPISEIADCNSATCPTMQDFNSWWYASKYMQVVNASSGTRQAAIDGWNAAIEAAHGIKEQK